MEHVWNLDMKSEVIFPSQSQVIIALWTSLKPCSCDRKSEVVSLKQLQLKAPLCEKYLHRLSYLLSPKRGRRVQLVEPPEWSLIALFRDLPGNARRSKGCGLLKNSVPCFCPADWLLLRLSVHHYLGPSYH